MNETVNFIAGSDPDPAGPMLVNATNDVVRHADIQRSPSVREDVDVEAALHDNTIASMLRSHGIGLMQLHASLYPDAKDPSLRSG